MDKSGLTGNSEKQPLKQGHKGEMYRGVNGKLLPYVRHCLHGCTAKPWAVGHRGQLSGRQAGCRAEKNKNNLGPTRHLCIYLTVMNF